MIAVGMIVTVGGAGPTYEVEEVHGDFASLSAVAPSGLDGYCNVRFLVELRPSHPANAVRPPACPDTLPEGWSS